MQYSEIVKATKKASPLLKGITAPYDALSADTAKLSINVLSSMPPFADVGGKGETDDTIAIQSRIDYVVAKVKANGWKVQTSIVFPSGIYNINNTGIVSKAYIRLKSDGLATFNFTGTNGTCLTINNDATTPEFYKRMYSGIQPIEGRFIIKKEVDALAHIKDLTGTAVLIGNTVSNAKSNGVSKCVISNISGYGFETAIKLGSYDTYLINFNNLHFEKIKYGIVTPPNSNNTGERMTFRNCTFSGCQAVLDHYTDGWDIWFTDCSFDFNIDIVRPHNGYGSIRFIDCYFEQVAWITSTCYDTETNGGDVGYLVNSLITTSPSTNEEITFENCTMYSDLKQYIRGDNINVHINGFEIRNLVRRNNFVADEMFFVKDSDKSKIFLSRIWFNHLFQIVSKKLNLVYNGNLELSTADQTLLGATPNVVGFSLVTSGSVSEAKIVEDLVMNGTKSLKIVSSATGTPYIQIKTDKISAKAGEVYIGSYCFAQNTTTEFKANVKIEAYNKTDTIIEVKSYWGDKIPADSTLTWKYCPNTIPFVCPPNTDYIVMTMSLSEFITSGVIYIDNITVNKMM